MKITGCIRVQGLLFGGNANVTLNQSGKIDNAYFFNNATANVSLPTFGSVTILSWSAWIYIPTEFSLHGHIWAKGTITSPNILNLLVTPDLKLQNTGRNNSNINYNITTVNSMSRNTWTHVVYTSNNSGRLGKLYINGVEQSVTSAGVTYNPTSVTNSHSLGYAIWDGRETYRFPFLGYIDEAAEWDRQISSSEVTDLYNGGAGMTY